jgi:hypothetical protein
VRDFLGSDRVPPQGFAACTRTKNADLAGCGRSDSIGSDLRIEALIQPSRLRLHTQENQQ